MNEILQNQLVLLHALNYSRTNKTLCSSALKGRSTVSGVLLAQEKSFLILSHAGRRYPTALMEIAQICFNAIRKIGGNSFTKCVCRIMGAHTCIFHI